MLIIRDYFLNLFDEKISIKYGSQWVNVRKKKSKIFTNY